MNKEEKRSAAFITRPGAFSWFSVLLYRLRPVPILAPMSFPEA
jgi:hypothetical protein